MGYKTGILLGQITKASGFEGGVLVRLEKNFIENIPEMESVFVETDGRPVPFFIEWSEYRGAGILRLKFDGYDSPLQVEEFRGCNVFLTGNSQGSTVENDFRSISGFTVLDHEKKLIGKIREVIENPGQLLLIIESPLQKLIMIPFHEDLISGIDKKKKVILMNIPEGLTDLNS